MRQLIESVRNPLEDEAGPTGSEYAVSFALIIVACVAAVTIICGH
jgi:Flp pilus assembly pilin Flp